MCMYAYVHVCNHACVVVCMNVFACGVYVCACSSFCCLLDRFLSCSDVVVF